MDANLFSNLTALVSGVIALVSAIAAWYSAGVAKHALDRAIRIEQHGLVREVIIAAENISIGVQRVEDLATQLKEAYDDIFRRVEVGLIRDRGTLPTKQADQKKDLLETLRIEAMKCLDNRGQLHSQTDQDLIELQTRFNQYLVQVNGVKEWFVQQLESAEGQTKEFR